MKLIVGLGNPGVKYQKVRHNLGFEVVDKYVSSILYKVLWEYNEKLKSEIIKTGDLIFAKPQTSMNNSGMAVRLLTTYYKLPSADVMVIHDELDLPLGKIKIRMGGAAAGHHGVESIISGLNTDQFIRVRLGIGNLRTQSGEYKGQTISTEKFVLEPFLPQEKSQVKHMLKQTVKAIQILLEKGLESTQNQFN
ncbi:aminoacyl-tRNA hydrolase [Candidatus Daviesbacteria bacterium]|nr:aminoacyl-tRNA hydrolase [Candidatus Daviesbacteria bacterium]